MTTAAAMATEWVLIAVRTLVARGAKAGGGLSHSSRRNQGPADQSDLPQFRQQGLRCGLDGVLGEQNPKCRSSDEDPASAEPGPKLLDPGLDSSRNGGLGEPLRTGDLPRGTAFQEVRDQDRPQVRIEQIEPLIHESRDLLPFGCLLGRAATYSASLCFRVASRRT